ncbi:MAG: MTH895/ArsE family thioredoxin-like protein [Syntrophobacteraceae bacterium]
MSDKDISKITVGKHPVSISGLKGAVAVLADRLGDRTDEEVGEAMLAALETKNYIPATARDEYRKAFTREFRKAQGQPHAEERPTRLDIKVLGAGCNQCNTMEQLVMETLVELNIPASLEHVTDMREIAGYGVLGVPALLINGKVVFAGSVPPKAKVKAWVQAASSGQAKK